MVAWAFAFLARRRAPALETAIAVAVIAGRRTVVAGTGAVIAGSVAAIVVGVADDRSQDRGDLLQDTSELFDAGAERCA
jgi:hypothetical protein